MDEWENSYLKFNRIVVSPRKLERALKCWNLPRDSRILDLGCGAGGCFTVFKGAGYQNMVGLDYSRNLLNHVVDAAALIQADALRCPFKKSSFDVVFVNKCLHHFHDYGPLVREIKSVLKPGGHFCFIEPRETPVRSLYHRVLMSPLSNLFPELSRYNKAALETEGETYFLWLRTARNFLGELQETFSFVIESIKKDMLHYVVKCTNVKE